MKFENSIAIFYTCGTCNLRCTYCGIDKNPILYKIDDALGKSFEGDYYFNQMLKYFPSPAQLKRIETWGGEPMMKMERIHPLLHKVIDHYPFFSQMFTSTNFSYGEWTDKLFGVLNVFGQYPTRDFTYQLQLSMDGPEYINDLGRGKGTTQKCVENFNKMVDMLPTHMPDNVKLILQFKQTLNNETQRMLCDKQKLIEYYQWFETFYDKIIALGMPNVVIEFTTPNTAVPSPVTKEEGIRFAELIRLCREIEEENKTEGYFKYYNIITPFCRFGNNPITSYKQTSCVCGSGMFQVGFLPDGLISTCHEGFTNLYEDYKDFASKSTRVEDGGSINFAKFVNETRPMYAVTEEGYEEHRKFMQNYITEGNTARLANITGLILALAMADQIDAKYLDEAEALRGAIFIQEHTAYCIKDNYNQTGSFILVPVGLLKLLLNGAREIIEEYEASGEIPEEKGCTFCEHCHHSGQN